MNINGNQFFNNMANVFNNMVLKKTTFFKPIPDRRLMLTNNQNNNQANMFKASEIQMNQMAAKLALLNQQQNANMLKELLNMPKNFQQLLEQIATKPQNAQQQTALMLLASTMDMSKLSSLLQNNSKEAMSNLYQMLAQYNQIGVSIKEEQIAQITKMISVVSSSASSDVQCMRTLMLLYLPWLPLTDPNAFKFEIEKDGQEGGLSSDDSVSILMSTENYGNVKADIFKTSADGIRIEFTTSENFPHKDFALLMKEESKKHNININLLLDTKEVFNDKKLEKKQTQVCMNTSPGVNPFLLLISSEVIKNIHEVDNKDRLREKRKEKLDNGES